MSLAPVMSGNLLLAFPLDFTWFFCMYCIRYDADLRINTLYRSRLTAHWKIGNFGERAWIGWRMREDGDGGYGYGYGNVSGGVFGAWILLERRVGWNGELSGVRHADIQLDSTHGHEN